ncbi:MAG: flagellar hook-basal body complex protein FliE [Acidobacteria bacterium]|nr:MAG: flagellar hook-basal body complex protein FliE [Acidobacteriota bacterium]
MAVDAISAAVAPPGATGITGTLRPPAASGAGSPAQAPGFVDSLGRLVLAADDAGRVANETVGAMLGGTGDVHEAMIALQQADIALQLTVQVRNKLVQAYQEIMRMPI